MRGRRFTPRPPEVVVFKGEFSGFAALQRTLHEGGVCTAAIRDITIVEDTTCASLDMDRLDSASSGEQSSLWDVVVRSSRKDDLVSITSALIWPVQK